MPEGIARARTLRRLPPAQHGDEELLLAVRGTVWTPVPTEEGNAVPAVVSLSAPAVAPSSALPQPLEPPDPVPTGPRWLYTQREKELLKKRLYPYLCRMRRSQQRRGGSSALGRVPLQDHGGHDR